MLWGGCKLWPAFPVHDFCREVLLDNVPEPTALRNICYTLGVTDRFRGCASSS